MDLSGNMNHPRAVHYLPYISGRVLFDRGMKHFYFSQLERGAKKFHPHYLVFGVSKLYCEYHRGGERNIVCVIFLDFSKKKN